MYSPGRVVPTTAVAQALAARQQPALAAPPRQTRSEQRATGQGGTDWSAVERAFANTPEARQQQQDQAKAAAEAAAGDKPLWAEILSGVTTPINAVFGPL